MAKATRGKIVEIKTNWELISVNQELFNQAILETREYFEKIGQDPDDAGFKEIAEFVNSKPFPYQPERSKREDKNECPCFKDTSLPCCHCGHS